MNQKHKQRREKKIYPQVNQFLKKLKLSLTLHTCSMQGVMGRDEAQEKKIKLLTFVMSLKELLTQHLGTQEKGTVQLNVVLIPTLVGHPIIGPLPHPWREPSSAYNRTAGILRVFSPSNLNKATICFSDYHLTRFIFHAYMPLAAHQDISGKTAHCFTFFKPGNKTCKIAISMPREEEQLPGLTTHPYPL